MRQSRNFNDLQLVPQMQMSKAFLVSSRSAQRAKNSKPPELTTSFGGFVTWPGAVGKTNLDRETPRQSL